MGNETDKIVNIDEFIDIETTRQNDSSVLQSSEEENSMTVYDYLEMAESAKSKKKALEYTKKALELDPDNIDAEMLMIELTEKTPDGLIEKYKELLDKSTVFMTEQGYFDKRNIGEFWLIFETRPYMRLMMQYALSLVECRRMKMAVKVCQEMLRLCENDNLGIRYLLMHLYAYLEDEKSMFKLLKQYPNEAEHSTQFLLPLSVLYYKVGDLDKAEIYLKQLAESNNDTFKFFSGFLSDKLYEYMIEMNPFGYRPFTIEEFIVEVQANSFLLTPANPYFAWGLSKLKRTRKRKSK